MRPHPRFTLALPLLFGLALLAASVSAAITTDGRLDPSYGPALSTQTTQTSFNDDPSPDSTFSDGSELDQAYGFVSGGVLHLMLTGNLGFCCGFKFSHQEIIYILFDTTPGGQNPVLGSSTLGLLSGLTFDADFTPDYWLSCAAYTNCSYGELPSGGGGASYFLGSGTVGPPGTISGGTNPYAILEATNNSNTEGVTHGCGAASGTGASTGVEWAIPLTAIGNPEGCFKVCAIVTHDYPSIGNQVLGPLPAGSCALGAPGGVNFGNIAGNQYITMCATTAVPAPEADVLALSPPWPNPFSGETRFSLTLDRDARIDVSVTDLSGRRIATVFGGDLGAGPHSFAWQGRRADGSEASSGVYFLQVQMDGRRLARRAIFPGGN